MVGTTTDGFQGIAKLDLIAKEHEIDVRSPFRRSNKQAKLRLG